jgi:putative ABC transport system permease protein
MFLLLEIVKLGLSNLRRHKLRSVLTALGIILGVAAVITNASIGEGAKRDALDQIERLGAKNIIIRSMKPPESAQQGGGRGRTGMVARYGLSRATLTLIRQEFPNLDAIVPLKAVGGQILRENLRQTSQAFGVTPDFLEAAQLRISRGRYLTAGDMDEKAMVCVLGAELARTMFPFDDPLGKTVRIDAKSLEIVGVLEPVSLAGGAGNMLVGRDMNLDLHLPLSAAEEVFGDVVFRASAGSMSSDNVQVSEIYCVAPTREEVVAYADRIRRVLEVRHPGLTDVTMIVPYQLLDQAERTALTWNLILTAIAGISLLVGGIGIMNIMLASVTERTREIGIRRALGATRRHITLQFLVETGVLSALGGLIGVGLGVGVSLLIPWVAENLSGLPLVGDNFGSEVKLPTELSIFPIALAFIVASLTGLVFGLYPAWRAAQQDPIVALRHD